MRLSLTVGLVMLNHWQLLVTMRQREVGAAIGVGDRKGNLA